MPNTENIILWVKALRSGKYKQGEGALHYSGDDIYCCLGVACEVARENGVAVEVTKTAGGLVRYDGQEGVLPASVIKWLGITDGNPPLSGEYATVLNDGFHSSFDEIADRVTAEYLPPGRLCTRLTSSLAASVISARLCLILS